MQHSERDYSPQVNIENFSGQAFFIEPPERRREPKIPDEMGRQCPQCGRTAWRLSRWCWHCNFDFDRAALPRVHPSKIAFLSLLANALLCFIVGFLIATSHSC